MASARLVGLLGLALRSRALAIGRTACRRAAARGRLYLVIVARDAGKSIERDAGMSAARQRLRSDLDKVQLGALLGRASVAVVGLMDENLARGIQDSASERRR